jgi:hypothetical protein
MLFEPVEIGVFRCINGCVRRALFMRRRSAYRKGKGAIHFTYDTQHMTHVQSGWLHAATPDGVPNAEMIRSAGGCDMSGDSGLGAGFISDHRTYSPRRSMPTTTDRPGINFNPSASNAMHTGTFERF